MDDARALLESLMGPNRNKTEKEDPKKKSGKPDFAERNICKRFLVGFCPHDWFNANRRHLEPCTKLHSDYLKTQFEAHPEKDKYTVEYEDEFLTYLEKVVADCDKFIARERIKCRDKGAGGEKLRMPKAEQEKCIDLEAKYAKLIKEAEEQAEESVSKSGKLTEEAMAVKDQIDALRAKHTHEFPGEEVCEVCGIRYALVTNGLTEFHGKEAHLNGRTHEGFTEIRAKAAELRLKQRVRERELDKEREKEREKEKEKREKDRDNKDRDREKERDRDQGGRGKEKEEKERDRDQGGRGKEKEAAKDRDGKEKERERRDRDKDRGKDRSRERSRDRGRGRSRSRDRRNEKAGSPKKKARSPSRSKAKKPRRASSSASSRKRKAKAKGDGRKDRSRSRSAGVKKSSGSSKGAKEPARSKRKKSSDSS